MFSALFSRTNPRTGTIRKLEASSSGKTEGQTMTAVELMRPRAAANQHKDFPDPTRCSFRLSGRDETAFRVDPLLRFGSQSRCADGEVQHETHARVPFNRRSNSARQEIPVPALVGTVQDSRGERAWEMGQARAAVPSSVRFSHRAPAAWEKYHGYV